MMNVVTAAKDVNVRAPLADEGTELDEDLEPDDREPEFDPDEFDPDAEALERWEFEHPAEPPDDDDVADVADGPESVADGPAPNASDINDVADVAAETADRGSPPDARIADDIARALRRFAVLDPDDFDLIALWVLHTRTLDAHRNSPRLLITSPLENCGKTTLCEALGQMVGTVPVDSVTPAWLFRRIDKSKGGTIILDEAHTYVTENNFELIRILNGGYRRTGRVGRAISQKDADYKDQEFKTFAPVIIARIGELPNAELRSRCLGVTLKRKLPGERVEELRPNSLSDFKPRVLKWGEANLGKLKGANPEIPAGLFSRDADNWRPLLAVADALGGKWPKRAREIAHRRHGKTEDPNERVMLLKDIRRVMGDANAISTDELLKVQIPTEGGHLFRFERGQGSDLKPATISI